MPQQRYEWLRRIKAVEREHSVTSWALARLLNEANSNPTRLPSELRIRDVRTTAENLDGTYLIRLFAEFETGLRLFWVAAWTTDPPSRTRDLLDGVAATRRISFDVASDAHQVRDYRNTLVHERDDPATPISIQTARRALCTYFSFLPLEW